MNWRETTNLNARKTGRFALCIIAALCLLREGWHHPPLLASTPVVGEETGTSAESKTNSYLSNHPLDYESCTNNSIVPKHWCLDDQKIPRYAGKETWPPRIIQHYTHEGYKKYLAEKQFFSLGIPWLVISS